MKNIIVIFKKELKRFFSDKRLFLSLIVPGILIFILYTFLGGFMESMMSGEDVTYTVYLSNQPKSLEFINTQEEFDVVIKNESYYTKEEALELLKEESIDLIITFEEDFDSKIESGIIPKIDIDYMSESLNSATIFQYYSSILNSLSIKDIEYNYVINPPVSHSTDSGVAAMMMTMLMPYLVVVLLITGCLAVTSESIAGEKERGTMATLLVTPVKRSYIATGKILALSIVSLISATSSFLGLILSLPKIMSGSIGADFSASYLGFGEYLAIFGVIIVLVLLFNVILSVISCFAKSVKEATQLATPVMLIVIVISVSSLFNMGQVVTNPLLYLIPVYNGVQCLMALFAVEFNVINFGITVLTNLALVTLGIFILTKMFDSEKMMFDK